MANESTSTNQSINNNGQTETLNSISIDQFNSFQSSLTTFENKLNDLTSQLNNAETVRSEEFLEAKRQVQLTTELKIADIKKLNGFDINDEALIGSNTNMLIQIQNIQNKNEHFITKIDEYEVETNQKLILNLLQFFLPNELILSGA